MGQRVNKSVGYDGNVDMVVHEPLSKEYPSPNMDIDRDDVGIYNRPDCDDILIDNDSAEE